MQKIRLHCFGASWSCDAAKEIIAPDGFPVAELGFDGHDRIRDIIELRQRILDLSHTHAFAVRGSGLEPSLRPLA
ncbi:MAG TPA: hypothetical protein VH934_20335 [Xanthobacteraceae bacterium]